MSDPKRTWRRASKILLTVAVLLGGSAHAEQAPPMIRPAELSSSERAELEAMMAEHIQLTLKEMKPAEGQEFPAKVVVRFDPEGNMLMVELGRRFVLKPDGTLNGAYVPDQLHMLTAVMDTMVAEVKYVGINYLFDGKNIVYYYPDLKPRAKKASSTQQDSSYPPFPPYIPPPVNDDPSRMYLPPQPYPLVAYNPPSVAINPGHGLYKLYSAGTLDPNYRWTTQRDPSNGLVEDEITPLYATEVKQWFSERSPGIDTFSTRSTSPLVHEQSTRESGSTHLWTDIGAKYHVEQLYPGRTDLWDVTSRTDNQRDRAKDINSRALFADEMGALAMISLHTNAAPDATTALTARGTQVFYATGQAEGLALASSIACHMEELIHAQPTYQNWTMRETRPSDQYAENSGSMPSALVEIAFHTNPDDALALQDSRFRTASMKGVEKGYRMWREAKPCQPLAIASVTDSTAPRGDKAASDIHFKGYPTFPVTLKLDIVKCPAGWTCTGGNSTYQSSQASPLTWMFACNASTTGVTRVRSTLIDADGVTSNPVESNVTCTTSTGTTDSSQGSPFPIVGSAQ
ncbi:N-acetylmuramoyl-L-alanine amidase [Lysobacter sp. LF1]|uniref:N-acetylmuramoyl-L-alanine amidase n=1 Tax=Lysobacter stagni TaxID=3045172 RepID=A0ABT6XGY6_9GAMM|nr:N-acetylmuramoyl-L-alanine amidase [Lysobacter sp. LF1]MDI9239411.1 N-acetylmuramoyl-L-alanine amidase [Lysobacter sp. LF1]